MSGKLFNLEIALIYFVLLIPWPQPNLTKRICSKDNSRLVRKIVRSKWTPILDKYQMKFPLECPLHPLRDVFAPWQDAKKRHRPTQWTCRLCGKSFFQEKFLDNHFDLRHKYLVNQAEDAKCVADLCDIMRCDVFQSEESSLTGGDSHIVTDIEVWDNSFSQKSSAIAKANVAYLSLIPIRQSTLGASRIAKHLNQKICHEQSGQTSAFKNVNKQLKEHTSDDESGPNFSSMKVDDQIQLNSSDEKSNQNKSLNIQKKVKCQSDVLSKLKLKCENLVRYCIRGLLIQMPDHKFKEMESEMNKAVCWYLSCDRYWEDGPLEPRAFPWALIFILITVLSLGICFCYYIIWILFDSEESTINCKNDQPLPGYHHSPRYISRHQDILERRDNINRLSSVSIMDYDKDSQHSINYGTGETSILRSSDINEISHNEHYIYVTYPPDLKKRIFENYE